MVRGRWLHFFMSVFLGWGLFLLAYLYFPAGVQAQSAAQLVDAESRATYTYGQSITFFLQATTSDEEDLPTTVQLTISAPGVPVAATEDLPVGPGRELATSYTALISDLSLLPFTTVTYSWTIKTTGGNSITVPPQTIDYVDDRYDWHSLVSPHLVVYWTDAVTEADARVALEAAAATQATLEPILPAPIADPLRIVIYPTTADMRSTLRLARREIDNGLPPADIPVVMVTAVNPRTAALDLQRLVPAEIARLRFAHAAGEYQDSMPTWLPVGLPALFETDLDSGYYSSDTITAWPDICSSPSDPDPAGAQSLVAYLRHTYGAEKLRLFIANLASGTPCEEAVLQQFDLSAAELNRLWQASAQSPTSWQRVVQENSLWIGLLLGGLLLMTLIFIPFSGRSSGRNEKNE